MLTQTIRVFLSSTFKDMKAERDALHRGAFRQLRDMCAAEGFQFQAIDLRWGVNEEAAWDQRTESLCLEEIRRCRLVTPRPNFVALVGQRYGWRPLPVVLTESDWDEIQLQAESQRSLLEDWYRLDSNNVPPVYRLRSRETESERDPVFWRDEVETPIRLLFNQVAQVGSIAGARLSETLLQSDLSLTEKEVIAGAENAIQDQWQAFVYFREFSEFDRSELDEPWVDRNELGEMIDLESSEKLNRLRDRMMRNDFVDAKGYAARLVNVLTNQGETEQRVDDQSIMELDQMVYKDLRSVIAQQIDTFRSVRPLEREIQSHHEFGRERLRNYVARPREESSVVDYVQGALEKPLVLHGSSGTGKTSLMARIDSMLRSDFSEFECITRFIGATGDSAALRQLIGSIHDEVAERLALPTPTSEIKDDIQSSLRAALSLGSPSKKIIVLLDALDQLSPDDHALSVNWIPRTLPGNCGLIVSCMTGKEEMSQEGSGVFAALVGRLDQESIVELSEPNQNEMRLMLFEWLGSNSRTLSQQQQLVVMNALTECPRPLYLRVLVEIAKSWSSDFEAGDLPKSIHGIIDMYLDSAISDRGHGESLLLTMLGLLAASRSGLTESEIFELLNRDTLVLDEFKQGSRYDYPDAKDQLPPVIWSRLLFDLDFFLGNTTAAGTTVVNFYHRQLALVAKLRCLDSDSVRLRHSLADFFQNSPTWYYDNRRSPNVRKAFELSYQLRMLGDDESIALLSKLLVDADFVNAKIDVDNEAVVNAHLSNDLLNDFFEMEALLNGGLQQLIDFFAMQILDERSAPAREFRPRDLHSFFAYRGNAIFYRGLLRNIGNRQPDVLSRYGRRIRSRARVDLAGMLRRERRFADSLELLTIVDEKDGEMLEIDVGVAWYEIAYVHYLNDEYVEAAEAFETSVRFAESSGDVVGAAISRYLYWWTRYLANPQTPTINQILADAQSALELFTTHKDSDPRALRWIMNTQAHMVNAAYIIGDSTTAFASLRDLRANPWVREFASVDFILPYEARYAMAQDRFEDAVELWEQYFESNQIEPTTEAGAWKLLDYGIALAGCDRPGHARDVFKSGLLLDQAGSNNRHWQQRIRQELDRLDDSIKGHE